MATARDAWRGTCRISTKWACVVTAKPRRRLAESGSWPGRMFDRLRRPTSWKQPAASDPEFSRIETGKDFRAPNALNRYWITYHGKVLKLYFHATRIDYQFPRASVNAKKRPTCFRSDGAGGAQAQRAFPDGAMTARCRYAGSAHLPMSISKAGHPVGSGLQHARGEADVAACRYWEVSEVAAASCSMRQLCATCGSQHRQLALARPFHPHPARPRLPGEFGIAQPGQGAQQHAHAHVQPLAHPGQGHALRRLGQQGQQARGQRWISGQAPHRCRAGRPRWRRPDAR